MSFKSKAYYLELLKAAKADVYLQQDDEARLYVEQVIAIIQTLDEDPKGHIEHIHSTRYQKGKNTLYYPALRALEASDIQAYRLQKHEAIPFHVEYFNPERSLINDDEPLMGQMTLEQYLNYTVYEFNHMVEYAMSQNRLSELFQAIASDQRCFEVAIRSARAWYQAHQHQSHDYESLPASIESLTQELDALSTNQQTAFLKHGSVMLYHFSTKSPKVNGKQIPLASLQDKITFKI